MVHSDSDLILHNSSVLIDKEPQKLDELIEAQCPVGRELDFLIQEMNREINTIGSKSNAIEIKNQVVQSKTILEKIREQVQNIE